MAETVILEHILPDGTWHYDWMIEDPTLGEGRTLRTWRTDARPDLENLFKAEQIGHHRTVYLTHQGPVSGGRGFVRRLQRGEVHELQIHPGRLLISVTWETGSIVRYSGHFEGSGLWCFRGVPQ